MSAETLPHLRRLEAEAIFIMREVVATAERPVMLYSIGKDSSVMLHLALKAFYPAPPPFPLLHVDTTWKFREMIRFRDETAKKYHLDLRVHTNRDGVARGVTPFTHGSAHYTQVMKTEALKQALDEGRYDAAFGGARRDEEKSRAKERVFSFRSAGHGWDPKNQRPELWSLYNTRVKAGESIRVFPLSNWTELDIWQYILAEKIDLVPLYFAAERPVVRRSGQWIMVDDDRIPLQSGEVPEMRRVQDDTQATDTPSADTTASLARAGASYRDARIKAIFAIAPALGEAFDQASFADVRIPVSLLAGSDDSIAPVQTNIRRIAGLLPAASVELLPGAGHYTFLDTCLPPLVERLATICKDNPGVDRDAVHARAIRRALDFFAAKLPASKA